MNRSRFQTNTSKCKPSGAMMLVQILILGLTITILAAIFVQNLSSIVQIFFLGQKSIAIPLSVAMLAAFAIGAIIALITNAIATWRQNFLIRRAVIATDDRGQKDQPASNPKPPSANYPNVPKDKKQEQKQEQKENKQEENYLDDDWEEEEEYDDEYEDIGDEFEDDEEYVDDDPETVPYGDLLKLKSNPKAKTSQEPKRDRPPLDVKFTRYTK
ncbi:MAG: hypothetical protein WCQ26_01455 [Pseudanabaena sp. ELA748]